MRRYELMIVLRTDAAAVTDEGTWKALVAKLVGDGVTITSVSNLGKKSLTYPMKKQSEGVYLLAQLSAPDLSSSDIQKRVNLDGSILRFLLTAK